MLRISLILTLLFSFSSAIMAQSSASSLVKARKLYEDLAYAQAIPFYEKATVDNATPIALLELAECYRRTKQYEASEAAYSHYFSIAQPDSASANALFAFGEVLKTNEKFAAAKKCFLDYTTLTGNIAGTRQARACDLVPIFKKDSSLVTLTKLTANTPFAEFSPVPFGDKLYFISNRGYASQGGSLDAWKGAGFYDIYVTEWYGKDSLGKVKILDKVINSYLHEGPLTFSPGAEKMYFTRSNIKRKKEQRDADGRLNYQIFSADYNPAFDDWENVQPFLYNDPSYSIGHPSLNLDGNLLFLISNMPGGYGGFDIYITEKSGEGWSQPKNLGPYINTPGDETFPYLHSSGTLYFSSDFHPGLGGLDIFSARLSAQGKWVNLKNLGYPLNTSRDDFGFYLLPDNKQAFFSSNRKGGKGDDDLYFALIREKEYVEGVKVKLYDGDTLFTDVKDTIVFPSSDPVMNEALPLPSIPEPIIEVSPAPEEVNKIPQEPREVSITTEPETPVEPFTAEPISDVNPTESDMPSEAPEQLLQNQPVNADTDQSKDNTEPDKMKDLQAKTLITEDMLARLPLESDGIWIKRKPGLSYKIQVGAFTQPLRNNPDMHFGTKGVLTEYHNDGLVHYIFPDPYLDLYSAKMGKSNAIKKGIRDAFIVPYYQNTRISLEKALHILQE